MSRIFVTRADSGRSGVNFSEIAGNSAAVAVSQAYYRDNRDVGSAAWKSGTQIGADMVGNVLKEFWPDLSRKLSRKHPNRL